MTPYKAYYSDISKSGNIPGKPNFALSGSFYTDNASHGDQRTFLLNKYLNSGKSILSKNGYLYVDDSNDDYLVTLTNLTYKTSQPLITASITKITAATATMLIKHYHATPLFPSKQPNAPYTSHIKGEAEAVVS